MMAMHSDVKVQESSQHYIWGVCMYIHMHINIIGTTLGLGYVYLKFDTIKNFDDFHNGNQISKYII